MKYCFVNAIKDSCEGVFGIEDSDGFRLDVELSEVVSCELAEEVEAGLLQLELLPLGESS